VPKADIQRQSANETPYLSFRSRRVLVDLTVLHDDIGDLLMTGPTLTNVNDFRAILIEAR
jgi:hypothetical protein